MIKKTKLLSTADLLLYENYLKQKESGSDIIYLSAKEWEQIPKILKIIRSEDIQTSKK